MHERRYPLRQELRPCARDGRRRSLPGVRRILANNPSPFTFKGTLSYIVGAGKVAIIDPGPLDEAHIAALLDAVRGETVTHIFVTHTHRDHSPAVPADQGGDRRDRRPGRRAASRRAAAQYRRGAAPRRQQRHRFPARSRAGRRRGGERRRLDASRRSRRPATPPTTWRSRCKERERAVLRRSCDGVVDADRGAAGRRDERLHGLARQARAAHGADLPAGPRRRGARGAALRRSTTSATARRARPRSCIGSARARPTSRLSCARSISGSIRG